MSVSPKSSASFLASLLSYISAIFEFGCWVPMNTSLTLDSSSSFSALMTVCASNQSQMPPVQSMTKSFLSAPIASRSLRLFLGGVLDDIPMGQRVKLFILECCKKFVGRKILDAVIKPTQKSRWRSFEQTK